MEVFKKEEGGEGREEILVILDETGKRKGWMKRLYKNRVKRRREYKRR